MISITTGYSTLYDRLPWHLALVKIAFVKHGSIGFPQNYILVKLSELSNLGMARHNVINSAQAGTDFNFLHCTKTTLFVVRVGGPI